MESLLQYSEGKRQAMSSGIGKGKVTRETMKIKNGEKEYEVTHEQQATTRSPLRKWLREPLIHFLVLGLAVFGLHAVLEEKPESVDDPFVVEVTSGDIEWFRTMWVKRMGREPTVDELRGQVNQLIREQVLSREAVSLGFDEGDMVVRRRLAQKMDFLFRDLSEMTEPSDSDLQEHLRKNRSSYETPGRLTFSHVYFNADKRGEEEAMKAVRLLIERFNTNNDVPSDISILGDPFLLQSRYVNKTVTEIRGEFGADFADDVWQQEPRQWRGPIRSGYGLHTVYIHERVDATLPDYLDLKDRLRVDWMAERQRELSRKAYEQLRGRYRVLVEGMPYDLDISG